jgi:SAM-dependent methyltransferase
MLKSRYAQFHRKSRTERESARRNRRLLNTYRRIHRMVTGRELQGPNADLGSGDNGFSAASEELGIASRPVSYPEVNLESDRLPFDDDSVGFVTLNAVIEHVEDPSNICAESHRILRAGGVVFIRTPNFQRDWRNFYNDPTHVRPYTPRGVQRLLELYDFEVPFVEPGLVEKSALWWRVPLKWRIASLLPGGTKSIICMGRKRSGRSCAEQ